MSPKGRFDLGPSSAPIPEPVMKATDGHGGDVCVEASGNDAAIASLFDLSAHSGRVRLIGHPVGRRTIRFMDRIFSRLHEAMETAIHQKSSALKVMLDFD